MYNRNVFIDTILLANLLFKISTQHLFYLMKLNAFFDTFMEIRYWILFFNSLFVPTTTLDVFKVSPIVLNTIPHKKNISNVLKVTATDLDSNENGQVSYAIIKGDNYNQFAVDSDTGYISVADELDRETVSNYVLEVLAKDNGIPVLSRQVLVNIEISDANDNPPVFSQNNYTTIIQVSN